MRGVLLITFTSPGDSLAGSAGCQEEMAGVLRKRYQSLIFTWPQTAISCISPDGARDQIVGPDLLSRRLVW